MTEAEPLVAYIRSGSAQAELIGDKLRDLRTMIEKEIQETGMIRIRKHMGLFVAQRQ